MASPRLPKVSDVVAAVNRIAPPHLAESWDNVGLQIASRLGRGRYLRRT